MSNLRNKYKILNYLTEKNYTHIEPLGIGGFGDIFSAISPQQRSVALKVIPDNKAWIYEEKVWSSLRHRNILPIIEIMHVKGLHCKIYVTPRHPTTLQKVVDTHEFKKNKSALSMMKKWFSEILSALDYLHSRNYCHMDVKGDNVLISMDDSAVLCDFSGLNVTGKYLKRLIAPVRYRSPECFKSGLTTKVEGVQFDMWTYGLLVLNVLTDYYAMEKMGAFHKSWTNKETLEELESCFKVVLQEMSFYDAFDKTFKHIWVSEEDKVYALDFVKSLLKLDPKERPTAAQAMRHPFLKENLEDDQDLYFRDLYGYEDLSPETLSHDKVELFDAPGKMSSEENCASEEAELKELAGNLIPMDVKEQDSNITASIPLSLSPSTTDFKDECEPEDHMQSICHLDYKECLSVCGETTMSKKKFSKKKFSFKGTKKWFEKKFNQVFKKKKLSYEKLIEDDD